MSWKLLEQNTEGNSTFNGTVFFSRKVLEEIERDDLEDIQISLVDYVRKNRNAYYKQVFKNNDGKRLLIIDNHLNNLIKGTPLLKDKINDTQAVSDKLGSHTVLFEHEYVDFINRN